MNIFVLDLDPSQAARYHCDKHVVKMIVETAQILSTAWRIALPPNIPQEAYAGTHWNHPCVRWAAEGMENYRWLWRLGSHLGEEFAYRYGHRHKTMDVINALSEPPETLPSGATPFVLCMPDEFVVAGDPVASYREYYRCAKAHLLHYTNREKPAWLSDLSLTHTDLGD